jgi:anti-sigma regulatory factor (Ser/Thr protein kinase)
MSASAQGRALTFEVFGGLDAPATARHLLLGQYDWPTPRLRDEAGLMLGEVVTNAVLHGGVGPEERLRIDVVEDPPLITFRVYDGGPGFDPSASPSQRARGGLGLVIVQRLARHWGVTRNGDGTCVWFEMALV